MSIFSEYISSDNLQFGFKRSLSCSHAVFTLRTVCDYFNDRGSNVYIASLDASKAFDKVDHARLFSLLISRKVPLTFINVIIDWYVLSHITYNKTLTHAKFRNFRSLCMKIETVECSKICLSAYDDKRFLLSDGESTLANGHFLRMNVDCCRRCIVNKVVCKQYTCFEFVI